ncbi:hypothetical protein ACFOWE_20180 [Planomonospora corallina]|uniref:Lipoprotein n=1 Tax=Planomonospora corallina TaxID=1806052 RepID=A0ABV8IDP8_9ACTN
MRAFACALALALSVVAGCGAEPERTAAQAPAPFSAAGTAVSRSQTPAPDQATARSPAPDQATAQAPDGRIEVSREQHRILTGQCRYADSASLREECLAAAEREYRVGRENRDLDCRTYSGVTVCGRLLLSDREQQCVREAETGGQARRRAEVECYVFA